MSHRIFTVDKILLAIVAELAATLVRYDKSDVLAQATDLEQSLDNLRHLSQTSSQFRNACQTAMWSTTGGLRRLVVRIASALDNSNATQQGAVINTGDWTALRKASESIRILYLDLHSAPPVAPGPTLTFRCTHSDVDIIGGCSEYSLLPEANTVMVRLHGSESLRSLICLTSGRLRRLELDFDCHDIPDDKSIVEFFEALPRRAPDLKRVSIRGPLNRQSQRVIDQNLGHIRGLECLHIKFDCSFALYARGHDYLEDVEIGYVPADGYHLMNLPHIAPFVKKLTIFGGSSMISHCFVKTDCWMDLQDLTLDLVHNGGESFYIHAIGSSVPRTCRRLRRLVINSIDRSQATSSMFSYFAIGRHPLEELIMTDVFEFEGSPNFFQDGEIQSLARSLPELRTFNFLHSSSHRAPVTIFSAADLVILILNCPRLRTISAGVNLSGANGMALLNMHIPAFSVHSHSLQQLELSHSTHMPDETIATALKSRYWRNADLTHRLWESEAVGAW